MTAATKPLAVGMVLCVVLAGCSADLVEDVTPATISESSEELPVNPWQSSDLTAALGAPPASQGIIAGYAFEAGQSQHLFYSAAPDHRILEMRWDIEGWHITDLTAVTAAAPADPTSLTAYVAEAANTQQVVSVAAADRHVQRLRWNNEGWQVDDLSAISGAPPATSTITGYSVDSALGEHIVYVRQPDRHVQEIWWDGQTWQSQDLSAATGAPAALEGALVGYVDEAQGLQHVIFAGINSHLYELWCDSSGWHMTDLTVMTETPGPIAGTPAGYMFDAQGTQHVVFVGVDAKIYELWNDSTGWQAADLTTMTGAPAPAGTALAAYAFESQGTQHVIYTGADGHLYELWWESGRWQVGNLSGGVSAPKPADGRPAAYAFEWQGTQHVVYRTAGNGHVYELWSGNAKG